jgi:hypothetical protein
MVEMDVVVELISRSNVIARIAHEIGHTLDASNDGPGNEMFIMHKEGLLGCSTKFSPRSRKQIGAYLDDNLTKECVTEGTDLEKFIENVKRAEAVTSPAAGFW